MSKEAKVLQHSDSSIYVGPTQTFQGRKPYLWHFVVWQEAIPEEAHVCTSCGRRIWGSRTSMQLNKRICKYAHCTWGSMLTNQYYFCIPINDKTQLKCPIELTVVYCTRFDILANSSSLSGWQNPFMCSSSTFPTLNEDDGGRFLFTFTVLENHLAQTSMLSGLWAPSKKKIRSPEELAIPSEELWDVRTGS